MNKSKEKKSHKGSRSREITVVLTLDQAAHLDELCKQTQMSRSAILRCAFNNQPLLSAEAKELLAEIRSDLALMGVNLNQVAKNLNFGLQIAQMEILTVINDVDKAVFYINQMLRP
ncbi:MAG: ribbon-helix-helix domain-containing protein [Burkholderiales bacterium]